MNEQEAMALFCKCADNLKQLEFCRDPTSVQTKLKIKWERGVGEQIIVEIPSEDVIRSYLMAFRKFYMQKEPTSILKIIGIAKRIEAPSPFKDIVAIVREMCLHALRVSPIGLRIDEKDYSPDDIIGVYFNGELFHSNDKMRAELEKIRQSGIERIFYFNLVGATRTIYACITILNAAFRNIADNSALVSILDGVKNHLKDNPLGQFAQISISTRKGAINEPPASRS